MTADAIPLDDRGLLLGDGLFETLLARSGDLEMMAEHAARLQAGAESIGLAAPSLDVLRAAALQALDTAGLMEARAAVRLTLTAGSGGRGLDRPPLVQPRLFASAAPAPAPQGMVTLATAQVRRNAQSPASRLKTLAYLDNVLARRQARAAGADEAIMLNTDGKLACCAAANLFWISQGRLLTPSLDCGVLAGVMRGRILAQAAAAGLDAAEVVAGPEALLAAEAVLISNSLIGVRAAGRVNGRDYPPHAALAALRAVLGLD